MLLPYPVDLFRLMDFDVIDQLIEHPGGQNLGSCVFTDGGDKHGSMISIDCTLVDAEVARNMFESSELEWLVSRLWLFAQLIVPY